MAHTMLLAASRERAAEVFVMREVGMRSWRQIRDALGFGSVGAVQSAYKRYLKRNPLPTPDAVRAGIVERRRAVVGVALSSLTEARRNGDHAAVARLVDIIVKADAETAKLFGLGSENVTVTVSQSPAAIIADARDRLLAVVDGDVIDQKEIGW